METSDPTEYYEIVEISADDTLPIVVDQSVEQTLYATKSASLHTIEANLAFWAVVDGILLVFILSGNILTILAVRFSRRLRSMISNMFILSLAISDMVVGLTLPYHLAFYMGSGLGKSREWCLLRFFLIIFACCVSIWNLIVIAVDRYIAIVYPLHYSRYMTKKVAFILLGFGWMLGGIVAVIPMFWNNWDTATRCEFDEILPPWYMAGIITPGFSLVWVCMLTVYWRIWREASKHAKQLRSSFTGLHETPSDWKSVQVVLFILGCFSICWLPYFIIACATIFRFMGKSSPIIYKSAFSLAMANSGINPIIYAWKNSSFRKAFAQLLRCKNPDQIDVSQHSLRSNIHRKSSSLHHQDTINGMITSTPPQSALSGHFFDENNSYYPGTGGNNCSNDDDNITYTPSKVSHSRRVSLALTHSVIPPSGQNTIVSTGIQNQNDTTTATTKITTQLCNEIGETEIGTKSIIINKDKDKKIYDSISNDGIFLNELLSSPTMQTANNQQQQLTSNKSCQNVVMEQVKCDGNGNTQICMIQRHPSIKDIQVLETQSNNKKQQQQQQKKNNHHQQQYYHRNNHHFYYSHNHTDDILGKINFLRNSKSTELDKIQAKLSPLNGHLVKQISNGNHIISSMNFCGSQLV